MNQYFRELRAKVAETQAIAKLAQRNLVTAENSCNHSWKEEYDPKYEAAYTIPGDPPGTMGIDWRGPCHVDSKTTPRWKRTCANCGKVEYTSSMKQEQQITRKPIW